jgi:hypothetical protein
MDGCINVYVVYMHWCIIYKCEIQTCTYGGGEWHQIFLLTKLEKKKQFYFSQHVFLSWHVMKKYNPWPEKKG